MADLHRRLARLELSRKYGETLQLIDDLWDGFADYGHPETWEVWPTTWADVPEPTRLFACEMYDLWRANPRKLTELEREALRRMHAA